MSIRMDGPEHRAYDEGLLPQTVSDKNSFRGSKMAEATTEPIIQFFVRGIPKGKARPRVTRTGHAYTPAATVAWEKQVKLAAVHAMGSTPMPDGYFVMRLTFCFTPPKSYAKKRRESLLGDGSPMPHKPDIDNLVKSVLDACNGIAYKDDAAVVEIDARKRYGEEDGVQVTIERLIFDGA